MTNSMGPVAQSRGLRDAIDYAERKDTIFIDVHPEQTTDPNGIGKRIIHPGVVSVVKRAIAMKETASEARPVDDKR